MSKKEPEKYPHFMELRVFFWSDSINWIVVNSNANQIISILPNHFLPLPHFVREADFGIQFIGIQMCLSLCYSFNIIRLFIIVVYYM